MLAYVIHTCIHAYIHTLSDLHSFKYTHTCGLKGSEESNLSPEESNNSATKMLSAVKDSMKEICLHEMIAANSDKSGQQPQMCAKVAVDKVHEQYLVCMYSIYGNVCMYE